MAALCLGMDPLQPHSQEPVCSFQHSCSSRGTSNSSSHLECSCDASCRMHGDCCLDSEHYNPHEQKRNVNEYVCVADTLAKNHVYVRAKCSEDWDNAEVQAQCMKVNTIPDTFYGVPVTSRSGQSYANAYCAICNYEDPVNLDIWSAYVVCDTVPVLPAYSNDDVVYYEDNVTLTNSDDYDIMYNEGRWGIIPRGSRDASGFIPCRADFAVPYFLRYATTKCLPTVKTCSDAGAEQHDRSLCKLYTAAVYHEGLIFRNQHCASCNGYKQFTYEEFRYGVCVSVQDESTLSTRESLCPGFSHSCSVSDFHNDRGCSCNGTCRLYGDCCLDSQYYDEAEQTKNANEYVCPNYLYDGINVYMIGKCLEDWDNTDVQASCLKGNTQTGDFKLFPVTSTTTAHTYVNHYCALCNGEDTASLRMWRAKIKCRTFHGADSNSTYNVAFHEGQWGIIESSQGISSFIPCSINFEVPEDIKNYTTPCLPTVKTCSDAGADQRDRILCQSYTAAVYSGDHIFRNQHCASCNGYKEYTCVKDTVLTRFGITPYFAMIVDYSGSCGSNLVGYEGHWDSRLKSIHSVTFMKSIRDDCLRVLLSEAESTRQGLFVQPSLSHTHANTHQAAGTSLNFV
ncbi:hypothetical protein O3P69_006558 [Scylla paramamosain]|uniref:SMB domain-containing protein n=1 Tax=Scylla paramamosain TaxID=85552 RepID=A0AAW0U6Q1_SCYPA